MSDNTTTTVNYEIEQINGFEVKVYQLWIHAQQC